MVGEELPTAGRPFRGSEVVVLLTATIDPGATPLVTRRDPRIRLDDYRSALETWLAGPFSAIVFVENSRYDLSEFQVLAGRYPNVRTEFISLPVDARTLELGKGHGEMTLMQAAFERSALLKNAGFVAKCTGRLSLRNAAQLLARLEGSTADLYCTFKQTLTFADSRFFISRPAIFKNHLFPLAGLLDDNAGIYFEHVLARAAAAAIATGYRWNCFPLLPYIAGMSGTFGTRLTDRPWTRAAKVSYHALRRYVYEH